MTIRFTLCEPGIEPSQIYQHDTVEGQIQPVANTDVPLSAILPYVEI